ncbi:radical SAM protein [Geoalkalibacter halelectricus]|uniref:radical SAM protein n=1 Tax=Geoalkalibacter halelectricus TaxID=2847045 RepID=UPI00266EDD3E|nr:radical SAM protein [Geoalkalibacter halelectricus]MDO3380398.1 radical SAM protein [Geoalkalibacter halelectricus]
MRVGLIDLGDKLPNLALMKLSTFHKAQGHQVLLQGFTPSQVDKVYISVVFTRLRKQAEKLLHIYPEAVVGGPGWDVKSTLPPEVESCRPDYDLYSAEFTASRLKGRTATRMDKAIRIVNSGLGFSSRGCNRECGFCSVPKNEGKLRQAAPIAELINPHSNVLTLLDNNLCADPLALDKLAEIRERGLTVNITQGIDVRALTPDLVQALSEVKHFGNLHFAWDQPQQESMVFRGIQLLSNWIKPYDQTCFVLTGFRSSFDEDMMRVRKLHEKKVRPYVQVFNDNEAGDLRLKHFRRWVNLFFYKRMAFDDYEPWRKVRESYFAQNPLF